MANNQFHHGISNRDYGDGNGFIRETQTNVIGLVCYADDADDSFFPLNKPVLITNLNSGLVKAGYKGNLRKSLETIQTIVNPTLVVVRIANPFNEDKTILDASVVIGSTLPDGSRTGLQALLTAKSRLGVVPKINVVPDLETPDVVQALIAINKKLRGFSYVTPRDNNGKMLATKEEVVLYRKTLGYKEVMLIWPEFTAGNVLIGVEYVDDGSSSQSSVPTSEQTCIPSNASIILPTQDVHELIYKVNGQNCSTLFSTIGGYEFAHLYGTAGEIIGLIRLRTRNIEDEYSNISVLFFNQNGGLWDNHDFTAYRNDYQWISQNILQDFETKPISVEYQDMQGVTHTYHGCSIVRYQHNIQSSTYSSNATSVAKLTKQTGTHSISTSNGFAGTGTIEELAENLRHFGIEVSYEDEIMIFTNTTSDHIHVTLQAQGRSGKVYELIEQDNMTIKFAEKNASFILKSIPAF